MRANPSRGILCLAMGFTAFLILLGAFASNSFYWNGLRLHATCALKAGVALFYPPGEGVFIAGLNAPLQPLFYWPVVWSFFMPSTSIFLGSLLASLAFLIPLLLVVGTENGKKTKLSSWGLLLVCLLLLSCYASEGLRYSATLIHADAPALLWAGLGFWWLVRKSNRRYSVWIATLFFWAAAFTKITLIPTVILPTVFFLFQRKLSQTFQAVLASVVMGAVLFLSCSLFYGFEAFYYGMFSANASMPWRSGMSASASGFAITPLARLKVLFAALVEMVGLYPPFFLIPVAWLFWVRKQRKPDSESTVVFCAIFAAMLVLPTSLMGRVKIGGTLNTFTPSIYFLMLAKGLAVRLWLKDASMRNLVGSLIYAAFAVLLVANVHTAYSYVGQIMTLSESPEDQVYRYSKANPGKTYFPEHPFAVCLAEGKVYHAGSTVNELINAGLTPNVRQLHAGIPRTATQLATPAPRAGGGASYRDWLPTFIRETVDPMLPGWMILAAP